MRNVGTIRSTSNSSGAFVGNILSFKNVTFEIVLRSVTAYIILQV